MRKKFYKILLIISGLIILVLFLLPSLIKRYVVNNSKELIGRQIDIDKVKYNYFTSTLKIYNFKMLENNESDNFISFDTLIVDLEPLKLFKDKIEVESFFLKGLNVNVIMKDSLFNFDDLIAFHSAEKDTTVENTNKDSFKFSISNIAVEESDFYFDNQVINHTSSIKDLSFKVPFIGWDQEEKSNADVKFYFPRGGSFQADLNINPIDGEFDARLLISDFYLDSFYKYVAQYAKINSFNGLVNSKIYIEGNINEAVKSIVSGQLEITDFVMTDTTNKTFLSVKKMDATIKELDFYNNSYTIDTLQISSSYTFFQLDSVTNNFSQIFLSDSYTESADQKNEQIIDPTETQSDLYYAINHLRIDNGILDYSDNLTGNPFDYYLSDIKVNSDSIYSDTDWFKIHADMLLNKRGTLIAEIGFNPMSSKDAEIDIVIENFLLSDLNIYTKHYTGHDIIKGDMYYYANSKISDGKIVSENKLLIKNVSVNATKGGLYALPLKFAVFLLTDKNGDVNLDIPIRGDLNDPTVRFGKIVWNTFKNLIVKTVASPINFLADLVDGDPKEMESISFSYLDSIPSQRHYEQLDKILELEEKKPGLKIEMTYFVDRELQKEALAKHVLGIQYLSDTKKDYLKDTKGFEAYLQHRSGSDSIVNMNSIITIVGNEKLDIMLLEQNNHLISTIRDYIKTTQASSLIQIKVAKPDDIKNIGTNPILKIGYGMQENDYETDNKKPEAN